MADLKADIRQVYIQAMNHLSVEIAAMKVRYDETGKGWLSYNQKIRFQRELEREFRNVAQVTTDRLQLAIDDAYHLGTHAVDTVFLESMKAAHLDSSLILSVQRGFVAINTEAVAAYSAYRKFGWTFSERIWRDTAKQSGLIQQMCHEAIAEGKDVVQLARDLTKYVNEGAATLSGDYPKMMARMGKRIPKNLNYEALRLARTELGTAFNEAATMRARENPACTGVYFRLSNTGDNCEHCIETATNSEYGEPGFYPKGSEPAGTLHPNCRCCIMPATDPYFTDRLIAWRDNPAADPELSGYINSVAGRGR